MAVQNREIGGNSKQSYRRKEGGVGEALCSWRRKTPAHWNLTGKPHKQPLSLERGIVKPGLDNLSIFGDAEKTISLYISYCKHVLKETPGSTETSFFYKQLVQQEKMCIQALGLNRQTCPSFKGSLYDQDTQSLGRRSHWAFMPFCL